MITVTRFNRSRFVINADWIETIESTPDTVITLTNGKKFVVSETVEEVVDLVIKYKQKIFFLDRLINTNTQNDDN
ncbi:MAG: flagellar FlbD family protein [Clostridiaceae bacterium]|nr:flagellar FlbD family protein [Clostridiaceae bacterium]